MSFEIPGKIVEEYTVRGNRLALVQFGNTCRPIFLDLVPEAHVGDFVRVHVGFATECVDTAEANRVCGQLPEHEAELGLEADEASPTANRRVMSR
jgi:hydrogenase assembly chaperone HypC/HupF